MKTRIIPMGVTGFLVRFAETVSEQANTRALAFRDALEQDMPEGIAETAPSLVSVFVRFDPVTVDPDVIEAALVERLAQFEKSDHDTKAGGRLWTIPCALDGPQLTEAAEAAGTSRAEAVESIFRSRTRVLTLGFAPGQPYLGMLEPSWDIPRMTSLNMNVPRGALVVAVRQFVLFTNASPTGWRHIGSTAFRTFMPERAQPVALAAGDYVQFAAASTAEIEDLQSAPDGLGGARVEGIT